MTTHEAAAIGVVAGLVVLLLWWAVPRVVRWVDEAFPTEPKDEGSVREGYRRVRR